MGTPAPFDTCFNLLQRSYIPIAPGKIQMKNQTNPPPAKTGIRGNDVMLAMNQALILGSVRQHELTEAAETLNARLGLEIAERKRAEGSVRISEIRYRRLFEAASDGLLLIDPEDGTITDANPCMAQLSGCQHDHLIGKQLWEIGLFANRTANRRMFTELGKTPEVYYKELPLQRCDGQRLTVEVAAKLYRENDRTVIQCHVRDITERKNSEVAQLRIDVLSASNVKLKKEIVQRQAAEKALHRTQQEQVLLLAQSRKQEEPLRVMSRRILSAQEEERKRISRELHDVISQILIGINVSMDALSKGDPAAFPRNFRLKINDTQRIVESAVNRIHHFCRELRPSMLDDLGLIPALQALLERFMEETGIRASLTAFSAIEESDGDMLTALFRVAQEALANVAQHALANHVSVSIATTDGGFEMEVHDDGIGIEGAAKHFSNKTNRLGLLGMKERVEMVGGSFQVESRPGKGTTIRSTFSNPVVSNPIL